LVISRFAISRWGEDDNVISIHGDYALGLQVSVHRQSPKYVRQGKEMARTSMAMTNKKG
jgi:hypothetical protein